MSLNHIKHRLQIKFPDSIIMIIKQVGMPNIIMIKDKIYIGIYFVSKLNSILEYFTELLEDSGMYIIVNNKIEFVIEKIKDIIEDRNGT